jgi:hypothetical protein
MHRAFDQPRFSFDANELVALGTLEGIGHQEVPNVAK